MVQKKWNTPPIITANLKLKELLLRVQRVGIVARIERAQQLLQLHLRKCEKDTNA